MIRLSPTVVAATAAAALLVLGSSAQAVPLNNVFGAQNFLHTPLGGTTAAARPELGGVVLADETQPFSYPSLNISGTVQSRVVREDGTGTLDFYWRVLVDPTSTGGGVSAFRLASFGYANLTDADWRIDGLGSQAPYVGRLFNPASRPDGAINFLFTDPAVQPGDPADDAAGSRFFFLHTGATQYARTAVYDLLAGPDETLSESFETFAPVPEPSSLALIGLGTALMAAARSRRA